MAAVLKTVRAKAHVGSNPTPSAGFDKHSWALFALGMSFATLHELRPVMNEKQLSNMRKVETIIEHVAYEKELPKGFLNG